MKTKIAYVAAMIAALSIPVLSLTLPTGCSSTPAPPAGSDSGVTPGTEGGGPPVGDGAVSKESAAPPSGTTLVPLTSTANGYVIGSLPMGNTVGVTGSWYAYGDSWGTQSGPGVAGEQGNCQLLGGFTTSQCSTITSPLPPAPADAGTVAATDGGEAGAAPPPPAGDDTGFPSTPAPTAANPAGTYCLTGTAALVIPKTGSTADDYSDIFGIGMGFDFNNIGGVKGPWNATANKVVGISFNITATGGLPVNLRVEFPTEQTVDGGPHPTGDSYDIAPSTAGTYQVLFANLAKPFPPTDMGPDANVSYAPTVDGGLAAQPMFDPSSLLSIQFHVATDTTAPITVTGLCVSNLSAIVSTSM